eukprot:snap_masked-scaffold_93-processed-gene-0.27-mRNA-1 protein AED:1.00 eAED:1.00 QI:0/0/0/0/1/1/2/0/94
MRKTCFLTFSDSVFILGTCYKTFARRAHVFLVVKDVSRQQEDRLNFGGVQAVLKCEGKCMKYIAAAIDLTHFNLRFLLLIHTYISSFLIRKASF